MVSSKFEAPQIHEMAEFSFDVQELIRNSEMFQESIMNENDVREALKLLEGTGRSQELSGQEKSGQELSGQEENGQEIFEEAQENVPEKIEVKKNF